MWLTLSFLYANTIPPSSLEPYYIIVVVVFSFLRLPLAGPLEVKASALSSLFYRPPTEALLLSPPVALLLEASLHLINSHSSLFLKLVQILMDAFLVLLFSWAILL